MAFCVDIEGRPKKRELKGRKERALSSTLGTLSELPYEYSGIMDGLVLHRDWRDFNGRRGCRTSYVEYIATGNITCIKWHTIPYMYNTIDLHHAPSFADNLQPLVVERVPKASSRTSITFQFAPAKLRKTRRGRTVHCSKPWR